MKLIRNMVPIAILTVLQLLQFGGTGFAQPDPPDRVARLNLLQGSVSYLPAGGVENDWVAASLNRPLTTGDRLWADANSRAELHIGSTGIRMNSNTGVSVLNLTDTTVQFRVPEGSLILKLRRLDQGNSFEVDTPNVAFSILRPGYYRIDVHPDGNITGITVRQGEGEAVGGGRSFQIISDQQVTLTGTDALNYDLQDADSIPTSDFDKWAMNRDAAEDRVIASSKYVSPEMTGFEDLSPYGRWVSVAGYGWAWMPANVPPGWAPYRFGHWVWIEPWGWTWVEDEPWGFAPFHYGRWAFVNAGWYWIPGPINVRPVYAPALVVWLSGIKFGVGAGPGLGWFPLGPHEVFVPTYHVSETYVTRVNVTNTIVERTSVVNVYRTQNIEDITYINRHAPNAVTVVTHETFVNARPVARNIVTVPPRNVEAARVSREISEVPERASVYGPGEHNAPHPPAETVNRPVLAKQNPPSPPSHFSRLQTAPPYRPPTRAQARTPGQAPPTRPGPEIERPQQHPLARPAPQVRPPTPQEKADMRAKQDVWRNAHPRPEERRGR